MSTKPELTEDVVAWAREEAQRAVDKLRAFQKLAEDEGDMARARGLRTAARTVEWMLIGGTGCVIAAFDERRPALEPLLRSVTPEMRARQDAALERIRERNRRIFGTEGEGRCEEHDRDHLGICLRCGQGLSAADLIGGGE